MALFQADDEAAARALVASFREEGWPGEIEAGARAERALLVRVRPRPVVLGLPVVLTLTRLMVDAAAEFGCVFDRLEWDRPRPWWRRRWRGRS